MKKYIISLIMIFGLITNGYCADQWSLLEPKGTRDASDIDAYIATNNAALDRLNFDHRQGVAIVYSSASALSLGAGTVSIPNAAGTTVRWRRNTSATSVTWANIDTGVEAVSQTYYVYAVADTDATTFTFLISTNSTTPTGATYYRKLGSFYNNSSGDIEQITNDNDYYSGSVYDSGWFAVSLNTAYTKTHSLGTQKLFIQVYYSTDSSGSNMEVVGQLVNNSSPDYTAGCLIDSISTTSLRILTGKSSLSSLQYAAISNYVWGGITPSYKASGYYRVLVSVL
jgi:hypothetical protein